ncbi:heme peroxidase [Chytriomyces hyalinus]|nr:heme peroxidase [Chytriomyces hyalinus]
MHALLGPFLLFAVLSAAMCPHSGDNMRRDSPQVPVNRRSTSWSRYYTPTMQIQDWKNLKQEIVYQIKAGNGPALVRRAWHDASSFSLADGTGGPHAQTLLVTPDKDIDYLKKKYPGASKADIISFMGAVAISSMGGPVIPWRPGRADAVDAMDASYVKSAIEIPATGTADLLRYHFTTRMGFTDRETVALLGAHNLGNCHLPISGYAGPWTTTPNTLSNEYFNLLVLNSTFKTQVVTYNNISKTQFVDNRGRMMLPADMALTNDASFLKYVQQYSTDKGSFFTDFASAYAKMLELGVADGLGSPVDTTTAPIAVTNAPTNSSCYPEGPTPFICVNLTPDGGGNTIFTVHSIRQGWVAIGVGSDSMVNGDVIVGWRNSTNGTWTNTLATYSHGIQTNPNSAWQQIPLLEPRPSWAAISFSAVHPNSVSTDSGLVGNSLTGDIIFAMSNYPPQRGNIDSLYGVSQFFQHDVSGILVQGPSKIISSNSNVGGIVGACVGVIVVVAILAGLGFVYRKKIALYFGVTTAVAGDPGTNPPLNAGGQTALMLESDKAPVFQVAGNQASAQTLAIQDSFEIDGYAAPYNQRTKYQGTAVQGSNPHLPMPKQYNVPAPNYGYPVGSAQSTVFVPPSQAPTHYIPTSQMTTPYGMPSKSPPQFQSASLQDGYALPQNSLHEIQQQQQLHLMQMQQQQQQQLHLQQMKQQQEQQQLYQGHGPFLPSGYATPAGLPVMAGGQRKKSTPASPRSTGLDLPTAVEGHSSDGSGATSSHRGVTMQSFSATRSAKQAEHDGFAALQAEVTYSGDVEPLEAYRPPVATDDDLQNQFSKQVEAILSGDVSVSEDYTKWSEPEVAAFFTLEGAAHEQTYRLIRVNNIKGSVLNVASMEEIMEVLAINSFGLKKLFVKAIQKLGCQVAESAAVRTEDDGPPEYH